MTRRHSIHFGHHMRSLKNLIGRFSNPGQGGVETKAAEPGSQEASRPVNHVRQDTNEERIARDAKYAVDIAKSYVGQMPSGRAFIQDKELVELGPGVNFGTALVLLSWGARKATVSDRFLASFQAEYHVPVYREVIGLLQREEPSVDLRAFEEVISTGKHETSQLSCDTTPLETLAEKYPEAFDITLSNAVFEHLYHPMKALTSLHRATRPGGSGFHQVDFRDHRDFSKPLEYLQLDEFSFHEMLEERHCECGNRIRPDEMLALFRHVGFDAVEFFPNMWAAPEYLADFIPRLRASSFSPYADISSDRLQVISGRFVVSR